MANVSPRVVQECVCDLSSAVDSGKLETESQEFEVLAENKNCLDPGNYVLVWLNTFHPVLIGDIEYSGTILATLLIGDGGTKCQFLPPLPPAFSVASLALHLVGVVKI